LPEEVNMKSCANALSVASLALVSTWGLSGCLKEAHATTAPTTTEARSEEAPGNHEHARHSAARAASHQRGEHPRHGRHAHEETGHREAGHKQGEQQHHEHGAHHDGETASQGSVRVGDKVPGVSVRTLEGRSVQLSELQKDRRRNRTGVVVLSFWCTTCHSCRGVEHQLARLSKDYEGEAAVMALDANTGETVEDVAAFLKKKGLELPVVLDPGGNTADLFGVRRTTTTVVIDGDGVLRYCGQFQHQDGGSAEEALKAVLAGREVAVKTTPHYG
jgi:thiol-disulfide isomerase/thioredoxin